MTLRKALTALLSIALFALPAAAMAAAMAAAKPPVSSAASAYYSGDVARALQLAPTSGDNWIAGLAAYRLNRFDEARRYFTTVAGAAKETGDLRAAGAYWAARSAAMLNDAAGAEALLQAAARWPASFYGMIAERHQRLYAAQEAAPNDGRYIRIRTGSDFEGDPGAGFAAAVISSGDNIAVTRRDNFPTPVLAPLGGFTIYPALVYAFVKQESGFNPRAISSAGAMGLMQLMPGTAAQTAKISKISNVSVMDSATNLRLGQDYVAWLVNSGLPTYDMLCAVAAYNGGPGTVTKVAARVGGYDNTLMIMESMPARETRDYVEKVMANYWTYQRKFTGREPASLDALASGFSQIDIRMDA